MLDGGKFWGICATGSLKTLIDIVVIVEVISLFTTEMCECMRHVWVSEALESCRCNYSFM